MLTPGCWSYYPGAHAGPPTTFKYYKYGLQSQLQPQFATKSVVSLHPMQAMIATPFLIRGKSALESQGNQG